MWLRWIAAGIGGLSFAGASLIWLSPPGFLPGEVPVARELVRPMSEATPPDAGALVSEDSLGLSASAAR